MSWYNEDDWRESRSGNHVLIVNDEIAATVYRNDVLRDWRIIINRHGTGYRVEEEEFSNVEEAKCRAVEIVNGADALLRRLVSVAERLSRYAP